MWRVHNVHLARAALLQHSGDLPQSLAGARLRRLDHYDVDTGLMDEIHDLIARIAGPKGNPNVHFLRAHERELVA